MNKEAARTCIEEIGIIPAIRVSAPEDALFAIEAVTGGGICIAEVTMTTPGALGVIRETARKFPELVIGAGSIFDIETARKCLDAGARFLTSPGLDLEIVDFALKSDAIVIPGALTPSEIMAAWKAGSDFVKIFPCAAVGGPSFIRALKAPFPDVPLIAAGGVTQQTAADFILAGAAAVGIGRDLIPLEAVQRREADWIHELTRRFLQIVQETRSQMKH